MPHFQMCISFLMEQPSINGKTPTCNVESQKFRNFSKSRENWIRNFYGSIFFVHDQKNCGEFLATTKFPVEFFPSNLKPDWGRLPYFVTLLFSFLIGIDESNGSQLLARSKIVTLYVEFPIYMQIRLCGYTSEPFSLLVPYTLQSFVPSLVFFLSSFPISLPLFPLFHSFIQRRSVQNSAIHLDSKGST